MTTVNNFIHPVTSSKIANARLKKGNVRLTDLPMHIQEKFDSVFLPRVREIFGHMAPWSSPDVKELLQAWSVSFPDEDSSSFDAVARKLVCTAQPYVTTHLT